MSAPRPCCICGKTPQLQNGQIGEPWITQEHGGRQYCVQPPLSMCLMCFFRAYSEGLTNEQRWALVWQAYIKAHYQQSKPLEPNVQITSESNM